MGTLTETVPSRAVRARRGNRGLATALHLDLAYLLGDGAMLFDANAALLEERQVASVRAGVLLKGGVAALVDGSGVLLLP